MNNSQINCILTLKRKGKPVERLGRKAMGLMSGMLDGCQAAEMDVVNIVLSDDVFLSYMQKRITRLDKPIRVIT